MESSREIAQTILDGFNRHYGMFREAAAKASECFAKKNWTELRNLNKSRINMYEMRVKETAARLNQMFPQIADETQWAKIKEAYICLLYRHFQPELAETFFSSVAVIVLHRRYHNNQFIFTRPAVATDYIEGNQLTYRCYYPKVIGFRQSFRKIFLDFKLDTTLEKPERCVGNVLRELSQWMPELLDPQRLEPNFLVQILSSLFFRNQTAYAIGRVCNGNQRRLFAIALVHSENGLRVDALLHQRDHMVDLFSVSNSYFMVDMEVPSAWVSFINTALLEKSKSEIYTSLGLQKQGKALLIRDLRQHLKHSADNFIVAPGIRGMVMFVFTLPSFPYVFKVIRDSFDEPKQTSREEVKGRYQLVKQHDRVGRLADTHELSDVALPVDRFDKKLIEEMEKFVPGSFDRIDDQFIIRHLYVESRMIPLDIYLREAASHGDEQRINHAIRELGQALRDLALTNIFPGDLLPKNFGISTTGKALFYDYDEVCYLTECNFRKKPAPRNHEDEMSSESWYGVGVDDVFPEELPTFMFHDEKIRQIFREMNPDLLDPESWIKIQEKICSGERFEIEPFPEAIRFKT